MLGEIIVTESGRVRIHTYAAPDEGWRVNTHLIELPTQIIAVDAQYTLRYAREVVDTIGSLGKPLTRLYITHYHPDHLLGAAALLFMLSPKSRRRSSWLAIVSRRKSIQSSATSYPSGPSDRAGSLCREWKSSKTRASNFFGYGTPKPRTPS